VEYGSGDWRRAEKRRKCGPCSATASPIPRTSKKKRKRKKNLCRKRGWGVVWGWVVGGRGTPEEFSGLRLKKGSGWTKERGGGKVAERWGHGWGTIKGSQELEMSRTKWELGANTELGKGGKGSGSLSHGGGGKGRGDNSLGGEATQPTVLPLRKRECLGTIVCGKLKFDSRFAGSEGEWTD